MSRKMVFITITLLIGVGLWWYGDAEPDVTEAVPESTVTSAVGMTTVSIANSTATSRGVLATAATSQLLQTQPIPADNHANTPQEQSDELITPGDRVQHFITQAQHTGAIPYELAEELLQQADWQPYVEALSPEHQLDLTLKDEIEQTLYQQLAESQYRNELRHFNCGGGFCLLELSGESEQQLEEFFKAAIKTQRVRAIFSNYQTAEDNGSLRLIFSYSDAIGAISVPSRAAK
ncbi:hypothetical protein AGRI_06895 [Alishewanella agri BL06]|uniref:Uncharacterized protein n=1 Tax=Alishewanella agri BL06 TaxID=1195246 RepID=I9P343_9ALTE|nr:hypothetical protein [Alishewanella agri]EIW89194.1 hypothetical protein AGRI_06895 [Alishewanella agri BL06]